jgi:hypothetical protein
MAFSRRFLGCFLCGDKKDVNDLPPATPVEFAIEGKNPQKSDDSFDSEPESTKDEEKTPSTVEVQPIRKNRVLVVASKGTYGFADEPFPEFAHDKEVIISNRATGLNPIDYKSVDYNFCLPEFPWVTGREMAGVVEEVGSDVTDVKVGDHVWTSMCTLALEIKIQGSFFQAHTTKIAAQAASNNTLQFPPTPSSLSHQIFLSTMQHVSV